MKCVLGALTFASVSCSADPLEDPSWGEVTDHGDDAEPASVSGQSSAGEIGTSRQPLLSGMQRVCQIYVLDAGFWDTIVVTSSWFAEDCARWGDQIVGGGKYWAEIGCLTEDGYVGPLVPFGC